MNFVKQHLVDGFTTKTKINVNKSFTVVAHKKALRHNKNAMHVNARNNRLARRTLNAHTN